MIYCIAHAVCMTYRLVEDERLPSGMEHWHLPCVLSVLQMAQTTEYTVTAAFWRTFHHEGKISLAFTTITITSKVAVYAPAEWADTLTLFHLYQYMYSVVQTSPLSVECTVDGIDSSPVC